MAAAYGRLESSLPGQFVAKFTIDEVEYEYTAGFSPPIELSGDVMLTYAMKDQLLGATAFVGEAVGGTFNLRFSAFGVSIFCHSPPPQAEGDEEAEEDTVVISGLGTWSVSERVNVGAAGTIVATSSTTFVAMFVVNDVRQKYSGTFRPPLSTFSSDIAQLSFNNEGQMIGSTAFTGEVGISGVHIIFSSPGITMSGPLKNDTTSKVTISGTGVWNDSSSENPTAYGTLITTSSSTFVASFTVDDAVHRYTAIFNPPISHFASNEMSLTFQNLGQLVGANAFTGEVGINGIRLFTSKPGLAMHGHLNNHLPSKITISGEGTWDATSTASGNQDLLVPSQHPQPTHGMISVNIFNSPHGSIGSALGNIARYGFDSEGNLVGPANTDGQRDITIVNAAGALGGMLGITGPTGDKPDAQTIFYAYAKSSEDDARGRYVITFATRDVADYWWRAVTDSVASGNKRFSDIQRISPQFYIHKPGGSNISETIKDSSCASHLAKNISFTLLNDRDTHLIPIIHTTDCLSGGRYFVRSALDPGLFWCWDGRVVRASRSRRTKFTVRAANAQQREGLLLVGSDNVTISVDDEIPIGSPESQTLVHVPAPLSFKFSEFKDAFTVGQDDTIVRAWGGECWRLVE